MPKGIVRTALWWIETAGEQPLSVAEIAETAGVSVFHLTRSFAAITGIPPARYLRMRRLTQAAHRLARGGEPHKVGLYQPYRTDVGTAATQAHASQAVEWPAPTSSDAPQSDNVLCHAYSLMIERVVCTAEASAA